MLRWICCVSQEDCKESGGDVEIRVVAADKRGWLLSVSRRGRFAASNKVRLVSVFESSYKTQFVLLNGLGMQDN